MNQRPAGIFVSTLCALVLSACGGGGGGGGGQGGSQGPSNGTSTRTFTNTGFTEVEINNSFAFIVQQGERFAVEVTVDSDDIALLKVSQDGVRLRVEFDPAYQGDIRANVARGIITLPELTRIELDGSAFADVAGFTQSYLEFAQSGSSHIEGANNRIDFVAATLDGNSHLSLSDIAPAPAAHIETAGSSKATIRVMNGGNLTGTAAGSSNIGYYGNNVNVQVSTFNSATVTWMGPL